MTIDELAATALQTKFNTSQIYHDSLPENGSYPMVCYTDLSETPALHADNKLIAKEHVIRVTLVTSGNATINTLKKDIEDAMTANGFMWQSTNKTRDGKEFYTSLDFSIMEV